MEARVANGNEGRRPLWGLLAEAGAIGALALLLLLGTWFDGAFDLRYWAPAALLGLAALIGAQLAGGIRIEGRARLLAAVAIWAFAGWTALSASWAESAALAWEGAARAVLYATLITLALAIPARRQALALGAAIVAGLAAIMLSTLASLFADGAELFLGGRLDDPVGYRNGTATLFAFGVWPLLGLAATRGRNPVLRGTTLSFTVLALGLVFLTQSRGVIVGLAAGAAVSLAIGPDRVRRIGLACIAAGMIGAVSGILLEPYHAFQDGASPTDSEVRHAATALTLVTLSALALGVLGALFDNGLRASERNLARKVALAAVVAVVGCGIVAAMAEIGNPVSYAEEKWEEFTELEGDTSTGSTRLGSVGGQRYDLWRVAWSEFSSRPLVGVGQGNYLFGYYHERRTDRNLSDPHSLPFRLLAETGLIGTLLFAGFLVALGVGIARAARSSEHGERRAIAGIAAAGAVVIGQSLIDWLWLIPTLTGLGLLALGLAAAPGPSAQSPRGEAPPVEGRSVWRRIASYGPATLWAVAALGTVMLFLSDLYVREARSAMDPQARLAAARTAEDLNPFSVTPLYLEASALETLGERSEARVALLEALSEEPENFVTLAVLGDLEVRAGRLERARSYYRRASELNPRDVGLRELARDARATP